MIKIYLVYYSPFPKRWDSKWSSEWKLKSSMVIIGLFSKCSFEKRHELWPSMISICILTSILIAEALGLWSSCLYESWVIYKNLNICDQGFQISGISEVKTLWLLFNCFAMEECDGGGRRCWAYAVEWPGFSIVEVFFIHMLCSRRKILAVLHTLSAPRRGVHQGCWKRTDLKEGTTDDTTARCTISLWFCTALERTPANLVV